MLNDKESDCGTVKGIWTGVPGSFCFVLDSQASTKDLGRSCCTVGKKQGGDKCRNFYQYWRKQKMGIYRKLTR